MSKFKVGDVVEGLGGGREYEIVGIDSGRGLYIFRSALSGKFYNVAFSNADSVYRVKCDFFVEGKHYRRTAGWPLNAEYETIMVREVGGMIKAVLIRTEPDGTDSIQIIDRSSFMPTGGMSSFEEI